MNKLPHALAAALFVTMAAIQLNDPDPLFWAVVYGATAAIAFGRLLGTNPATATLLTAGMVLAGLLMSAPGTLDYFSAGEWASIYGKMLNHQPYIESAREFGGLLIAGSYLAAIRWRSKFRRR